MGMSPVPPRIPDDRSLLKMPVDELLAVRASYQGSMSGSRATDSSFSGPRSTRYTA